MPGRRVLLGVLPALALLAACDPTALNEAERETVIGLSLSALPALPEDPSNRVADLPAAAAFGATLFFDTRLSADGRVACATCHQIDRQFQDDRPRGEGLGLTERRTMPLAGVAWSPFLFWDGRSDSLWAQALQPLEDPREHGFTRTALAHEIAARYGERYARIFGPLPALDHLPAAAGPRGSAAERAAWQAMAAADRAAVDRVFANAGKAIAAFERTLRHPETRFDRFAAALARGETPTGDAALDGLEREGLKLFIGKGACIDCHNGPRLTDEHFHNTGVPAVAGLPGDTGRAGAIGALETDPFNCLGPHSDAPAEACTALRFMVRQGAELVRAYKTPSLRGAASRPPYMHAGQYATLEAVIEHYATAPEPPAGRSELTGIVFTERGRKALIAFLKTLEP